LPPSFGSGIGPSVFAFLISILNDLVCPQTGIASNRGPNNNIQQVIFGMQENKIFGKVLTGILIGYNFKSTT
jgi:hypothetical protein